MACRCAVALLDGGLRGEVQFHVEHRQRAGSLRPYAGLDEGKYVSEMVRRNMTSHRFVDGERRRRRDDATAKRRVQRGAAERLEGCQLRKETWQNTLRRVCFLVPAGPGWQHPPASGVFQAHRRDHLVYISTVCLPGAWPTQVSALICE